MLLFAGLIYLSACNKDNKNVINPVGYFSGQITVSGVSPKPEAMLVRSNNTLLEYSTQASTLDTSSANKKEFTWSLNGTGLSIKPVANGMGYFYDCTLKAPTDSITGTVYILSLGTRQDVGKLALKRIN